MFCEQGRPRKCPDTKQSTMAFSNGYIMRTHQVGCMGGIRKSEKTQSIVLIINPKVHKYSDLYRNQFEIFYDGEFRKGHRDQVMMWGNKILNETTWPIHVYFGWHGEYEYFGEYQRHGMYQTTYDASGRRMFVFPIRKKITITYDFDTFEN